MHFFAFSSCSLDLSCHIMCSKEVLMKVKLGHYWAGKKQPDLSKRQQKPRKWPNQHFSAFFFFLKEGTGELSNAKRPERPQRIIKADDHRILSFLKKNFTTSRQVMNTFECRSASLSQSIIKRRLYEYRGFTLRWKPPVALNHGGPRPAHNKIIIKKDISSGLNDDTDPVFFCSHYML